MNACLMEFCKSTKDVPVIKVLDGRFIHNNNFAVVNQRVKHFAAMLTITSLP